jgi:hypothetical protein
MTRPNEWTTLTATLNLTTIPTKSPSGDKVSFLKFEIIVLGTLKTSQNEVPQLMDLQGR